MSPKLTSPYKTRIPATGSRNHSAVPGSHIDLDSQIGKCYCTCPKYVCTAGNGCQTTAVLLKMVCHTSPNATRQGDPRAAMRCGVGCSSERSCSSDLPPLCRDRGSNGSYRYMYLTRLTYSTVPPSVSTRTAFIDQERGLSYKLSRQGSS